MIFSATAVQDLYKVLVDIPWKMMTFPENVSSENSATNDGLKLSVKWGYSWKVGNFKFYYLTKNVRNNIIMVFLLCNILYKNTFF